MLREVLKEITTQNKNRTLDTRTIVLNIKSFTDKYFFETNYNFLTFEGRPHQEEVMLIFYQSVKNDRDSSKLYIFRINYLIYVVYKKYRKSNEKFELYISIASYYYKGIFLSYLKLFRTNRNLVYVNYIF